MNEILKVGESENSKTFDVTMASLESSLQEYDVDKEANLYFERVYRGEVPVQDVVNMLLQLNKSPPKS